MNKKVRNIILICILAIMSGLFIFYMQERYKEKVKQTEEENKKIEEQNLISDIKSKFNDYVITTKDATLYEKKDNEYKEIGTISKNMQLELINEKVTKDTKYFFIKGLNYYISYNDIEKINKLDTKDTRYKKYIVFNENVVTDKITTFYKDKDRFIKINKKLDLPIIIKEDDRYYVEYNNELYYLNKKDISKTKKNNNTSEKTRNNTRTLTYHTIYDTKTETCSNTTICHPIEQFDEHMKYLHDNNYLTLTMKELELFLDQKIQIPKKSVVVTLDDGKYAKNAVKIVEKYQVYATYFIITARHSVSGIKSNYMDFQSHTNDMHNNYRCSGGVQGGELLCAKESDIINDLNKSREVLGTDVFAIAYPFFDFNQRAIDLLKQTNFRLAFVGQYNTDGYSTYKTNKYIIPRKTIFSTDSLKVFAGYLK